MIPFTIYDPETGEIKRVGSCPDNMLESQAQEGEAVVVGNANPITDFVSSGIITRKSEAEIEEQDIELAMKNLRSARDVRLKDTDWTQVTDAPVDASAWATYRQELRDLPQNTTDPREVVWPTPPQ